MKQITIIGGGASGTLVAVNLLRIGIDAKPEGRVIDKNNKPSDVVHTLGTALRGILWETTAIPEIRSRARDLALKLLAD